MYKDGIVKYQGPVYHMRKYIVLCNDLRDLHAEDCPSNPSDAGQIVSPFPVRYWNSQEMMWGVISFTSVWHQTP